MQTLHQPHPRPHMSHSALTSALGDSVADPYDYNEYATAATVFPDHHGASGLAAVASNAYNAAQSQSRVPAVANNTQSSMAQNYHHPHTQPVRQQTHHLGDRPYSYYSDTLTAGPHATYTRSQDGGGTDMSGSINSNSGNGIPSSSYSQAASSTYSPSSTATNSPFSHAQSVSPAHGLPSHTSQGHVQQTRSQYSQRQQARQGGQQGAGISSIPNATVPTFPQQQYTNATATSQGSPGESGSGGTLGAAATTSGGGAKRRPTGGGQAAASGGRVSGNYGASSRKRQRGKETDSDSDDEGFAMFRELTIVFCSSPSFGCWGRRIHN